MFKIKECKLHENNSFFLVQNDRKKLKKIIKFHLFLVIFLRCDVFVFILDNNSKLFDLLAEFIAFLFAFGGLIFQELTSCLELFVGGFDLSKEEEENFINLKTLTKSNFKHHNAIFFYLNAPKSKIRIQFHSTSVKNINSFKSS